MNFLAHLLLSGDDPKVRVGNFIGDFIKGKIIRDRYEAAITKGIEMHRAIDYFTDLHPIVRQSKNRLRTKYRHFSGIIVDIFYDHFLAAGWSSYSTTDLPEFAAAAYAELQAHEPILPEEVKYLMPYMTRNNWLVNYAQLEGIQKTLSGMARRTRHESHMEESVEDLRNSYAGFKTEFEEFFPELQRWAEHWIIQYDMGSVTP